MTWISTKHFLSDRFYRSRKNFLGLCSLVLLGNWVFCLLLSFFWGIEKNIVEKLFPPAEIELKPNDTFFAQKSEYISDKSIESLRQLKGVMGVYPRKEPTFPVSGHMEFRGMRYLISGIVDGIDPLAIENSSFIGFNNPSNHLPTISCASGDECPIHHYCSAEHHQCKPLVPLIVSPLLLELVNQVLSSQDVNLPKLNAQMILDLPIDLVANFSNAPEPGIERKSGMEKFRIVGVHHRALGVGGTVPLGYIDLWNKQFGPQAGSKGSAKVLLVLKSQDDLPAVAAQAKALGFSIVDKGTKWIGIAFLLFRTIFFIAGIGFIVAFGFAIGQAMLRSAENRRKEFGIFMAVGATTTDLKKLLWLEAGLITGIGSLLGLILSIGTSLILDRLASSLFVDIQLRPSSYFSFPFQLWMGALILPCIVAAFATR